MPANSTHWLIAASFVLTMLPAIGQANLVAHWAFDEPGGATAFDGVGSVDGILTGGSAFAPGAGILGGAVFQDGASGSYVDMGNNFMFASVDFSVQVWVRTSAGNTTPLVPVYKHQGGWYNGYFLAVNDVGDGVGSAANNRAHFYATNGKTDASSTIVNDGLWHQLVGVYDVTHNQTRLYVDGAPESTGPRNAMVGNAEPFLVHSEGYVDEIRLWDHALSDDEVSNVFTQTSNPVPLPPAVWLLGCGLAGLIGLARKRVK